jgi:hypothetical protein
MPVPTGSVGTSESQYWCPARSKAPVIEVTVTTVKEVSDGLTGTVQLSIGVPGESLLSVNKVSNIGDLPVTPNVGKSMYSTATLI